MIYYLVKQNPNISASKFILRSRFKGDWFSSKNDHNHSALLIENLPASTYPVVSEFTQSLVDSEVVELPNILVMVVVVSTM